MTLYLSRRDPTLEHQLDLVTNSHHVFVTCNCLQKPQLWYRRRGYSVVDGKVVIARVDTAHAARIQYERWHLDRGIQPWRGRTVEERR